MGITFPVDDVTPARERLPERGFRLSTLSRHPIAGASADELILVDKGLPCARSHGGPPDDRLHALVQAVDLAHREHRPLRLTPDAIWFTLAHGFALHVRQNAEALRARLVRHAGRKRLSVQVLERPSGAAWRELVARLVDVSAAHLGPGMVKLLTSPFSTTGPDEQMVFRIALLEACAEYFEYEMVAICGIPEITLEGTAADWRDIKQRVEVMGEYDLRWWTDQLLPLCDQWIATAEGRPDGEFWSAICRPRRIYGGHLVTGWLARLFPYVEAGPDHWKRNDLAPAREIPDDKEPVRGVATGVERARERLRAAREGRGRVIPWAVAGVSSSQLPQSWSTAEVIGARGSSDNRDGTTYHLGGGLVGVAQDRDGLCLQPVVAWIADERPGPERWRRLEQRGALVRAKRGAAPRAGDVTLRGALSELYRRYERGTLAGGAITLLPRPSGRFVLEPDGGFVRDGRDWDTAWFHGIGLEVFALVGEHGALGWLDGLPRLSDHVVSMQIPLQLDWFVFIPDIRRGREEDLQVVALDGETFIDQLAAQESPWFLGADAKLPGRLVDLVAPR